MYYIQQNFNENTNKDCLSENKNHIGLHKYPNMYNQNLQNQYTQPYIGNYSYSNQGNFIASHENDYQQQNYQQPQLIYDPMAALAFQYGSSLAQHSTGLLSTKIESSGLISRLKVLFAVNHRYVLNKLKLILFPFLNKDWSVPLDIEYIKPVSCLNAPDLYLPVMAFITYIIILSFQLGYKNRFSPENLSLICSSLLAFDFIEYLIGSIIFYLSGLSNSFININLFAIFGYKYISACICIICGSLLNEWIWIILFSYFYLSLVLFMAPTIKANVCKTSAGKKPIILLVVWPTIFIHLIWLCKFYLEDINMH